MKLGTKILSLGLLVLSGASFAISRNSKVQEADAIGNYSTNASTYYNSITATDGKQLAAQLHDLITSTHRYYTSYDDNGKNLYQQNTDQYYENGSKVNGYIYEFYSGVKWPNAWAPNSGDETGGYNREHCWCQSNSVNTSGTQMWGTDGGGADMHHLRPVEVRLNSTRNNHPYGEVGSNRNSYKVYAKLGTNTTYALGGYYRDDIFEPIDSKKGDVARIILYTYLHYNSYANSTLFGSYGTTNGNGSSDYFSSSLLSLTKTTSQTTEAKALEMLLSWNASDPVDEIEQRRNEQVAKYQGNRNPFIDNSNYAEMIWGDGSSTPTPTVNSVTVSPSTLELDLNGTKTGSLTANVSVSNGAATTVSWESSNTNVATVSSSGVVTAKAKGTCHITATSTVNSNKSDSCDVTVVDTSSSGGKTMPSTDYELYSGALTEGNYVIYYNSKAMKNTTDSGRLTYSSVTPADDVISSPDDSIVWHIAPSGNYWTIYNEAVSKYAAGTGAKNAAQLLDSGSDDKSLWTVSGTATYEFVNKQNTANSVNANLRNNGAFGFACYSTSTGGALSLYKQGVIHVTLSSISVNTSNAQTMFEVGDEFDYTGIVVTATYTDGTEDVVEPTSVSSPVMSTAGEKTIIVSYTEDEITKTADYTITVAEAETSDHGRQPDDPLTVSEAIAICEETGQVQTEEHYYTQGIVSKITTAFSSTYGNISFDISADGTTSGDQLNVFRCKYLEGAKFTSADQLTVGMEVIIVGYLVNYNSTTPEYASNSYVYRYIDNSGSSGDPVESLTIVMSQQGYSNGESVTSLSFYNKNSQTISGTLNQGTNSNNDPKYYNTGSSLRMYAGNTLTIDSSKANITSITFTFASGEGDNAILVNTGSISNGVWTGTASSIVFTIDGTTGHRRIASIAIDYFGAEDFAQYFNNNIGCNVNGTSAPTGNWSTINNKFNTLFKEDQDALKEAGYTVTGSGNQTVVTPGDGVSQDVANCVSKYDLIVRKYHYNNFMSREGLSSNSDISLIPTKNFETTSIIIIVVSLISVTALGGFLFIKHKKEQ